MAWRGGAVRMGLNSAALAVLSFTIASALVSAERNLWRDASTTSESDDTVSQYLLKVVNFLWQPGNSSYEHVWPPMKFGWKIIVGSVIGFLGAAFGSVGGVGGGGIYVPMLSLIVGFDPKSSTAISKCMIMGAAASTVYYNLKLRHPTLDMPIIDYDLALLFQPMLMLGISIGVTFNVIFADWMVTVLLIILFLFTSIKAFLKGVETWKKETIIKKMAADRAQFRGANREEVEYEALPSEPRTIVKKENKGNEAEVPILENVCWKELGLLVFVWVAFLFLQISIKNLTTTCSTAYWVLSLTQIPVAVGISGFEAVSLYKGRRVIASKGDEGTNFKVHQLILYCCCGILAGMVGGLLGLGGGFILGPLFLELGIPPQICSKSQSLGESSKLIERRHRQYINLTYFLPWVFCAYGFFQVSSATATFAMTFSSSMSVVEYYLLKRFPVPYALYFVFVATIAAFVGQHVVRRMIIILGRASLIIFILAFTIFVSAISLGGVGISNMVEKIEHHEYMGFEDLCSYKV